MNEIVWEAPPATRTNNYGVWERRLAPLRDRPGEWGRFDMAGARSAFSAQANVTKGRVRLPEGTAGSDWEATARLNGAEGSVLYVRFIGKPVRAVS